MGMSLRQSASVCTVLYTVHTDLHGLCCVLYVFANESNRGEKQTHVVLGRGLISQK